MTFLPSLGPDSENEQGAGNADETTMSVMSSINGGVDENLADDALLGLDSSASKSKLNGSTLAVGVTIVVGVLGIIVMSRTLRTVSADDKTKEAMAKIEAFIGTEAAAESLGIQGAIDPITDESQRVIEQLEANPTDHQVPSEEVEKNPFALFPGIIPERTIDDGTTDPPPPLVDVDALKRRHRQTAEGFHIDSISGSDERAVVFINGSMYRVGDEIQDTGFTVFKVEGLDVLVLAPEDETAPLAFRLHYE